MNNVSLVSAILLELAKELDIELLIEPEYGRVGRIKTKEGKISYYCNTKFDINTLGASGISKDKGHASFFLNHLGYSVPQGDAFYSDTWCKTIKSHKNIAEAVLFAEKQGYPLIVKPNSESQGRGVEKVYDKKGLLSALSFAFDELRDNVALVQQFVAGKDYRIVVVDDQVLCAYRRTPLSVTGNGKDSIRELLLQKQQLFITSGRDTVITLEDPRIERKLVSLQKSFNSVLRNGEVLFLLDNANLSSGGQAEDVTPLLHEDYKKMVIQLTHDMGLRFCGVDIITPSPIDQPMKEYTVIEINSAPGLDYYAETGNTQKMIVKELYKKVILSIIKNI